MKLFHFTRLINRYAVTFCLHRTQGGYVAGKWEDGGEIVREMSGAIFPMGERKIYASGGVYTAQDREMYLSEPLRGPLSALKVVYDGNVYGVESARDYSAYADVAVYNLKWQSKVVTEHD